MSKQTKQSPVRPSARDKDFDLESSRFFVPICFLFLFIVLVFLFRGFIFSDGMLHGSDMINAGIQARTMLVDYVKSHGEVPQWNPYLFGGLPFVEAFHGDIFYPLSFLKFFGPVPRMIGFVLFWHVFLAGVTMYFAARQFKLSKVASVVSASAYMFAPVLVSLVAPGHDGKMFVTALYPLMVLFLDRGFATTGFRSFLNFTITGGVVGLIILTPHPQMSYFMLWSLALYAAFKLAMAIKDRREILRDVVRPAALTGYAVMLGLFIAAIQFYPGFIYTTEFSPRADTKKGWDWATSWSMHEEEAFSLLIPEFVGSSAYDRSIQTVYWGKNAFKDNSESIVGIAFLLGLIGFFFSHRREGYFFGGLAIFALLYALADTTPLFTLFYGLIPKVDSLRAPSMIMFLFSFSFALLAGMGVQFIIDKRKAGLKAPTGFYYLLFGFPAFLLLFAFLFTTAGKGMLNLWTSIFYSEAIRTSVGEGITKLDAAVMNLPAITSGAWFAFLWCGGAALLIWAYARKNVGVIALALLAGAIAFDGARFNARFITKDDPNRYWGPNPIANFLQKERAKEEFRAMNFGAVPANFLAYFGIPQVVGYHGNQLRWYDDHLGGIGAPNQYNARFLNLVGARYLVIPAGQGVPPGYFGPAPVTSVASFADVSIHRNENAFPRAFLADSAQVVSGRESIYPRVIKGTEDLRQAVLLEEPPALPPVRGLASTDSARISFYDFDSVVVAVNVSTPKLLVLTDNYYDSWHAVVDGKEAPIHRAYASFRAVALPAGAREVVFYFHSSRYATGRTVTFASVTYLIAVVGVGAFLGRRRREEGVA